MEVGTRDPRYPHETAFSRVLGAFLMHMMSQVDRFQQKILGIVGATSPRLLDCVRMDFKMDHLREEFTEIREAWRIGDLAGVVDGIVDVQYLAAGMLVEMGVSQELAFEEVQEANMRRVSGLSKRGNNNDAIKPPGWTPPDHAQHILAMAAVTRMSPMFFEALRIKEERGARYNQGTVRRAEHFPFGDPGHAQMMWIKAIRIRSDVEGGNATHEQLDEHIVDMVNYLSFWWEEHHGGVR